MDPFHFTQEIRTDQPFYFCFVGVFFDFRFYGTNSVLLH